MTTNAADERVFRAGQDDELWETLGRIVTETPVTDLHTHLYAPAFGGLLLWGVDELLTYHYLIAEVLRATAMPAEQYYSMPKREQADLIWKTLFIERSPIGEGCRGVVTALKGLGLDVGSRKLDDYRAWFAAQEPESHIDAVYRAAGIHCAVMTNDPFDDVERPVWLNGFAGDPRFRAALRIDPLLNDWPNACRRLKDWGYDVEPSLGDLALAEVRRFLEDWLKRTDSLYMAVSLPPDFAFPEVSARATLIEECILPVARERACPFAMMIGVKRGVNPALRLAGDGVARADLTAVQNLCANHLDNKFMITLLSRENQHELTVMARKFSNLFLFGCWWFLNNPSLIEDMTRMRIELLGLSVAPQHSDARVLEQVIYKWDHSRRVIGKVLEDKYGDLLDAGWTVTEGELRRDVGRLLAGNFWEFVGR
ncbi:MAG: glucuronate isomerase [FCB group bacterium]|jgi:hypothetical protein|nr:glucuronate isomerase [FCB group bacterium]